MLSYVFACLSLKYLVSQLQASAPAGSSCKPDSRCYMMLCSVHGWFAGQHIYSRVPYWFRNSSYWNYYSTMKGCFYMCLYSNSLYQDCHIVNNLAMAHNILVQSILGHPTIALTHIRSGLCISAGCRSSTGTCYIKNSVNYHRKDNNIRQEIIIYSLI